MQKRDPLDKELDLDNCRRRSNQELIHLIVAASAHMRPSSRLTTLIGVQLPRSAACGPRHIPACGRNCT